MSDSDCGIPHKDKNDDYPATVTNEVDEEDHYAAPAGGRDSAQPLHDSSSSSDSKDDERDSDEIADNDIQDNFDNNVAEYNDEKIAAGPDEIISNKVEHNTDYNVDIGAQYIPASNQDVIDQIIEFTEETTEQETHEVSHPIEPSLNQANLNPERTIHAVPNKDSSNPMAANFYRSLESNNADYISDDTQAVANAAKTESTLMTPSPQPQSSNGGESTT